MKSTFSGKFKKKLDFDSNLEAKNTPNHEKNVFEHVSFWASVLGGFFFRFWAILTPFWEAPGPPKSGQKCKKTVKSVFWMQLGLQSPFWLDFLPFWMDFGAILAQKTPLGQIVPQTTSGTNRSKNNLSGAIRYTLYANIRYTLYAIRYTLYAVGYTLYAPRCALYTIRFTLYAIRHMLYATRSMPYIMRCTLYAIRYEQLLGQIVPKTSSGTNRSKNRLWDKSFQKQTLGQIVPKNNKKTSQQILPIKPSKKKGAGRVPRGAAQCARPLWSTGVQTSLGASHQMLPIAMSALL